MRFFNSMPRILRGVKSKGTFLLVLTGCPGLVFQSSGNGRKLFSAIFLIISIVSTNGINDIVGILKLFEFLN
jgi:hypothetical protein